MEHDAKDEGNGQKAKKGKGSSRPKRRKVIKHKIIIHGHM